MQLNWTCKPFDELTNRELYAMLQLRNRVFVLEQNCLYQDADGKDLLSWHLAGWNGNELAACARILPPGISFEECSIGRVVCSPEYRNKGLGKELMRRSIQLAFNRFNCPSLKIGAQLYLQGFYESLGFIVTGTQYLEDGIPHIDMCLAK
jgi:ElaA protein